MIYLPYHTVYPKKYARGFVVLCFVVVTQSFIMNSHEVFVHIHQGCFAGTGAIVRLPQCQWSKPDGYGKISQCITTTKHSKAKSVCIFLGIYCTAGLHFHEGNRACHVTFMITCKNRPLLKHNEKHQNAKLVRIYFSLLHIGSGETYFICLLTHRRPLTCICVGELYHHCDMQSSAKTLPETLVMHCDLHTREET